MRLEREGPQGLAVVDDNGWRSSITGASVRSYEIAMFDYSGERARWSEASLHADGDQLLVHVVKVIDHEGGVDRDTTGIYRSADGGRTWTSVRAEAWTSTAPAIAKLSTHTDDLERVGNYRLIRRIGAGSLGELHEASDANGASVAVRFLNGAGDAGVRARVEALAQKLPQVRHPNVVAVREILFVPDGRIAIATDLTEGTLEKALVGGRGFAPARAASLASNMLAGLEALHAVGVVHGDLRPANVFLVKAATVPWPAGLADAGLLDALEDPRGTRGTGRKERAYLPPEALRMPFSPDVLTDIYGVGACLYEMLRGERAFAGSWPMVAMEIVTKEPPPLPPSIPPALAAVVARAMSKSPAARYPTAAAMREALATALG